jgi:hypothetical protein
VLVFRYGVMEKKFRRKKSKRKRKALQSSVREFYL